MPLDWWNDIAFWNQPDNVSKRSWPWCRAILNEVMDARSQEMSLQELDTVLDTIDSREAVRWRVRHFLAKKTPYKSSFSYIWCSQWGLLMRNDTNWEYFVVECIDDKVYKTILPNSLQSTWSDPWDVGKIEYIDLGFMFSINTQKSTEQRRDIFFNQARKWFAGRKSRKVSLKNRNDFQVYNVNTSHKVKELTSAEMLDQGFSIINY